MSVTDVTARIDVIQSRLALLGVAPTGASGASGSFGSVLSSVGSAAPASATARSVASSGQGPTGDQVVDDASQYLGIPYVWGGTDPKRGLDCSGLVQRVYADLGVDLPRVSRDQARVGTPVASLDEAQPGDLLAFGSPVHHIAIYVGDGQMIEAPRPGLDVRVSDVWETPSAIRRVVGGSSATTATSSLSAAASSAGDVPFADLFDQAASTYGIDPTLLAAVARQESAFDPDAVSAAGAQGLMQLMPGTAAGLGVQDSFDPAQAVDGAARLLSDLLDRFGSTPLALAAYNAGPGAVMRYDGIPPYPETQNYVRSVMAMVGSN